MMAPRGDPLAGLSIRQNVEDLVNGELINCLFSPSLLIEDAAFESSKGGGAGRRNKR